MTENKIVKVTNRNNGFTSYSIPEMNVARDFAPGEQKKIPYEEIRQLSYMPGGEYMIKNYLIVEDEESLEELNIEVEPEYFYTEETIKELLLNGTLDQLEDALNFGPNGVKELIKQIAVETEIPDTRKRELISAKTGFSIESAINVNRVMNAEEEKEESAAPTRKAAPMENKPAAPKRKAPSYKVVSKGE